MSKQIKKILSLVLSLIMVFSAFSLVTSAATTSLAKVKDVSAVSADDDEINIKWSKVSGATGYQVYIRSGNSGSWKKAETTKKNYAEIDDLKSAHTYSIRVRAYAKSGANTTYGSFSKTLKAITDPDEPKNVSVSAVSDTKAKLEWSEVSGAVGYRVYKYDASLKKWVKLKNVSGTSCTVAVSKNGGDKFRVKAFVRLDSKAYFGDASDAVVSGVETIGYSKAKKVALENAGVKAADILNYEAEYEKDGKIYVYEIEFETKKYEYEYTINALSGKIIQKDIERR